MPHQQSSITVGSRQVNNLLFADDIDLIADSESELQSLTDSPEKSLIVYGMEISHEKSEILVNGKCSTPKIIMYGTNRKCGQFINFYIYLL